MLDGVLKKRIDPALDRAATALARRGIGANQITILSCVVGLAGAGLVASGYLLAGLAVILFSRIGDGLDGAVARATRPTDFGGYLDIVLDFVFYGAVPLAFVLLDPAANGVAGAVLIFSFYVNGASFLAYAIIAEKRKLTGAPRQGKGFFFTAGLAEAAETYAAFALFCLFPQAFPVLALIFAGLCFVTATARILGARAVFAGEGSQTG